MDKPVVSIVDYGMGNLFSVRHAFEHCGAEVKIVSTDEGIRESKKLVLPGVGAFADGMKMLQEKGLINALHGHYAKKKPFLGICLGMQMMMDVSEEFGRHTGLKWISGNVEKLSDKAKDGSSQKIPHIGWNKLVASADWQGTLLDGIPTGEFVYFVHSFTPRLNNSSDNLLATTEYGGRPVTAVIRCENLYGCQFHPEKSGPVGLQIIRNFLRIPA